MGKYMSGKVNLSDQQKDAIISSLMKVAESVGDNGGTLKKTAKSEMSSEEKERYLNTLFNDPTGRGLRRVAYAMTEPLRTKLDYVGIGRKFLETDLLPQGVVPVYDKDFPETPAVKISARGNPPTIEGWSERVEVNTYEIATVRAIKYAEIAIRRFNALDRTKDKAAFELKIAEDDDIFSAVVAAGTTSAQNTNVASDVTLASIADAFSNIEKHRLVVGNILMHPTTYKGIRKLTTTYLDQVNTQALLETGLFASIYGANIYVSDRASTSKIYVMATPKQLGRMPIRYDVEVKPFDYPPEREVLFSVYENIGITVYNTNGVATITIT